jgi:hypothetical protein
MWRSALVGTASWREAWLPPAAARFLEGPPEPAPISERPVNLFEPGVANTRQCLGRRTRAYMGT